MKKALSILTVLLLLITASGCQLKKKEAKAEPPKVKDVEYSDSFKGPGGKTSFVLNVTLPQIKSGCPDDIALVINSDINDEYEELKRIAEANAGNAESFMNSVGSDFPWTRDVTYEISYADADCICFIIKSSFSITDGEPEYFNEGFCYDLKTGFKLDASDFGKESEEPLKEDLLEFIYKDLDKRFSTDGSPLTNEQKEYFSSNFDLSNFYFDAENLYFCFMYSDVDPDSEKAGQYIFSAPYSKLGIYFMTSAERAEKEAEKQANE